MIQTIKLNQEDIKKLLINHFKAKGLEVDKISLVVDTITTGYGMMEHDETKFSHIDITLKENNEIVTK